MKHKMRLNNFSIFSSCLTENTVHLRYKYQVGNIVNGSNIYLLKKHINAHLGH
jgi:hypothetical protein